MALFMQLGRPDIHRLPFLSSHYFDSSSLFRAHRALSLIALRLAEKLCECVYRTEGWFFSNNHSMTFFDFVHTLYRVISLHREGRYPFCPSRLI